MLQPAYSGHHQWHVYVYVLISLMCSDRELVFGSLQVTSLAMYSHEYIHHITLHLTTSPHHPPPHHSPYIQHTKNLTSIISPSICCHLMWLYMQVPSGEL